MRFTLLVQSIFIFCLGTKVITGFKTNRLVENSPELPNEISEFECMRENKYQLLGIYKLLDSS